MGRQGEGFVEKASDPLMQAMCRRAYPTRLQSL